MEQQATGAKAITCQYHHQGITLYCLAMGEGISHLTFSGERHAAALRKLFVLFPQVSVLNDTGCPKDLNRQFTQYLLEGQKGFSLSIDPFFLHQGTAWQQRIWALIAQIPFGETRTYGDLAAMLGKPGGSRAVGAACGANPLAIIIPCHRVVGKTGLRGFAGGTPIKEYLLALEKRESSP